MRVRMADARRFHADEHVMGARRGNRNVVKFQRLTGLDEADGFHFAHSSSRREKAQCKRKRLESLLRVRLLQDGEDFVEGVANLAVVGDINGETPVLVRSPRNVTIRE